MDRTCPEEWPPLSTRGKNGGGPAGTRAAQCPTLRPLVQRSQGLKEPLSHGGKAVAAKKEPGGVGAPPCSMNNCGRRCLRSCWQTGLGGIFLARGWAAGHNERSADDEMAAAFPYLIGTALLVFDGLLAIGYAVVKALI